VIPAGSAILLSIFDGEFWIGWLRTVWPPQRFSLLADERPE